MAKQYKRDFQAPADNAGMPRCEQCKHQDPAARYNHWLEFDSLDDLEAHISVYIKLEDDRMAILRSYRETRDNWQGLAHPVTGAPMHWREARQMAFRDARSRQAQRTQERNTRQEPTPAAGEQNTTGAHYVQRIIAQIPTTRDPWAMGHLTMMQTGLNKPGKEAEAGAFCHAMAKKYPGDAPDWRKEAEEYERSLKGAMSDDSDLPF